MRRLGIVRTSLLAACVLSACLATWKVSGDDVAPSNSVRPKAVDPDTLPPRKGGPAAAGEYRKWLHGFGYPIYIDSKSFVAKNLVVLRQQVRAGRGGLNELEVLTKLDRGGLRFDPGYILLYDKNGVFVDKIPGMVDPQFPDDGSKAWVKFFSGYILSHDEIRRVTYGIWSSNS